MGLRTLEVRIVHGSEVYIYWGPLGVQLGPRILGCS